MPWGACLELRHERGLAHLSRLLDESEQIWSTVTVSGSVEPARRLSRADAEAGLVWLAVHLPHHWLIGFFAQNSAMITSVRDRASALRAHDALAGKARRAFVTLTAPAYLCNPFNALVDEGV